MSATVTASAGAIIWCQSIWNAIAVPILAAMSTISGALQGYVTGWFPVAATVYIVGLMLVAAWTPEESSATNFFRQLFLAFVVYAIAATAGGFSTYATGLANGIVNGVSGAVGSVLGSPTSTTASTFDGVINQLAAVGLVVWKHAWGYGYVAGVVVGIACIFYFFEAVLVVFAIFAIFMASSILMQFLLAFGPIFIACYFFPFTRRFFDGWLGTVVSAMIAQIFIVSLMVLFVLTISIFIQQFGGGLSGGVAGIATSIMTIAAIFGAVALFLFMAFMLGKLAISIGGGAHAQFARIPNIPGPRSGGGSGGGPSGGGSPGGGSEGPGGGGERQYSFNRSVGGST